MKILIKVMVAFCVLALLSTDGWAQSAYGSGSEAPAAATFVKKRYNIKGTWNVSEKDGQKIVSFSDDFKTKGGPDLKLYLSTKSIAELESGNVEGTSTKLGVLKSNKGAQSYIIPADVNLSEYKSLIIHCEAFEVLWGGFNLAENQ